MKLISGGITGPRGFLAAGGRAGIKQEGDDLALVFSEAPAVAAAMFTTNDIKAAPVLWSQRLIAQGKPVRAIVVNSGNANACTGSLGMEHAISMGEAAAASFGVDTQEVLVASTGVIGVPLPVDLVCDGIQRLSRQVSRSPAAATAAARAILTTDTCEKQVCVQTEIDGVVVTVGGMAKGSGMIHPNMATMLAFVATDANISRERLAAAVRDSVNRSYNMISVDGDTSTNDSVFVLANGLAGNPLIDHDGEADQRFREALDYVNLTLAKAIARDGEGATKFLEVAVTGARTVDDARKLARTVVSSNLVKAAMFGEDANWGRVIAAMGRAGAFFDPAHVRLVFRSPAGAVTPFDGGEPVCFDEAAAAAVLRERDITVEIHLNDGLAEATAWGCDLSYEYVRINGDYRT